MQPEVLSGLLIPTDPEHTVHTSDSLPLLWATSGPLASR